MASLRILQISDLHVVPNEGEKIYGVDSYASLERVLEDARKASPDLVIATGDLTERGDEASYRRLAGLLPSIGVPVLVLPGNHDSPRRMASFLCRDRISAPRTHDEGGWRFVLLDSRVRGAAHGEVTDEDRQELRELLTETDDTPTVVALHHPPISPCPAFGCQLVGAASLLDLLAEHACVKAVIAGHSHLEAEAAYRGIRVVTTPSTCAVALHSTAAECTDLEDFWASHSFDPSRHGYRMLDLEPDGTMRTEVHWISSPAST